MYGYVLLYTDNFLVVSENSESVLKEEIVRYLELKLDSIGPPSLYLGGHLQEMKLDTGTKAWDFRYTQYVQYSVKNVEGYLSQKGKSFNTKVLDVLPKKYHQEIDISEELGAQEASYFQYLIGIIRRIVELGRVDICTDTIMMSSHLVLPRHGNLERLFHIFSYLNKHQNSEMLFDPTNPYVEMADFQHEDWGIIIFGDVKEEMPSIFLFTRSGIGDMPEPRGQGFTMTVYVHFDLGGDCFIRISRTGFTIFLNGAPLYWRSSKQNIYEVSTFGSESKAMK